MLVSNDIFGGGGPPMDPAFGGDLYDFNESPVIEDLDDSSQSEYSDDSENPKKPKIPRKMIITRILFGLLIIGPLLAGSGIVISVLVS